MASVRLQPARGGGGGLKFGFVQLPASAAEVALEELDGRMIYELTGDRMLLKVAQSRRSVQQIQQWRSHTQRRAQRARPPAQLAAGPAGPLQVQLEGGGTALLQGRVSEVKKGWLCDGPPSSTLWLGNVAGEATPASIQARFSRQVVPPCPCRAVRALTDGQCP